MSIGRGNPPKSHKGDGSFLVKSNENEAKVWPL